MDVVIDTKKMSIAIEYKYGMNVSESDLSGLRSFEAVSKLPVKKYVLYRGTTRQTFSKGEVAVPFQDFFDRILPLL